MRKQARYFLSSMLLLVLSLLYIACGSTNSTSMASDSTSTSTTPTISSTPQTTDVTATAEETSLIQRMTFVDSPIVKIDGSEYTITGKIKNGDAQKHDIYVTATLNDASGKEVVTSTIFKVEDLDEGGTGSYTISGTGIPANTKTLTAHVTISKVTFSY